MCVRLMDFTDTIPCNTTADTQTGFKIKCMDMWQIMPSSQLAVQYCLCVRMYPHTVYGALLGMQKGRSVDVCNSFELVVNCVEGRTVLDKEYFT